MHRQICVCLGVVCVTVALTTPVRGQYGNPYALEPMQPYDYGEPDTFMDDYYERKERTQRWQDRRDALDDDYAQPLPPPPFSDYGAPCDFMTGNAAAQQRCYESRR